MSSTEPNLTPALVEPEKLEYAFFPSVPLTLKENLAYRKKILHESRTNPSFRKNLIRMCKADSLFWASSFCMLYEPRPQPHVLPFIPWVHQVPAWRCIEENMGYRDVGLEKSRGEGASWIAVLLLLHKWLYVDMFTAGLVSLDERTVDNPENPDSLFWKLDWQLTQLPPWMVPGPRYTKRIRAEHSLTNLRNKSNLVGFAATGTVGSGGRKVVFVMDELAKFKRGADKQAMDSVQFVTDSRILISTPYGPDGEYYKAMHSDNDLVKVTLHWTQNPTRIVGAYRVLINRDDTRDVELIDKEYWLARAWKNGHEDATEKDLDYLSTKIKDQTDSNPFNYRFMLTGGFVKHGVTRSVWYDGQCRRPSATPPSIAQELDLDYGGSRSRFFDISLLDRIIRETCYDPTVRGEVIIPDNNGQIETHSDLKQTRFRRFGQGKLWFWFEMDLYDRVPQNRNYVIGCDISSGGGGNYTSNSALCVIDRDVGRQVAEFASPDIYPVSFAELAVGLCYLFHGRGGPAALIWEANGPPGAQFGKRIQQLGYNNVFFRAKQVEGTHDEESKMMGWWSSPKSKPLLLSEFARGLDTGELEMCSAACVDEAKAYMNLPGEKIEHIAASTEEDPSGAGARHGDRVIAAALAWWVAKDYRVNVNRPTTEEAPDNSVQGRLQKYQAEAREKLSQRWMPRSARRREALGRPAVNNPFSKKFRR